MTIGRREDPYAAYNFLVVLLDSGSEILKAVKRIDRLATAGFSECSGLESTIDIEEYREGGNNGTVLKFPTRATTSPIQLKRGVSERADLWIWHNGFMLGRGQRRDGLIVLQNESRDPVKFWAFYRGILSKYRGPTLAANQNQVAIEEVEIVHEGLALVSPATSLSSVIGGVQSAVSQIREIV